jgi:hypothetical protein
VKVAVQNVLRFLRFQAPWAYGRNFFALLSQSAGGELVKIRNRRMEVAEKGRVRDPSRQTKRPNIKNTSVEETFFLHEERGYGNVAVKGGSGI